MKIDTSKYNFPFIKMDNQDTLTIEYRDPAGKTHTINITTQHFVVFIGHEESDAAMLIRPSVGVQFIEPSAGFKEDLKRQM